jgi:hypothetical protein
MIYFKLKAASSLAPAKEGALLTVVPDSGTGQLVGLAGRMAIQIDEGKHSYNFEYTLAETL